MILCHFKQLLIAFVSIFTSMSVCVNLHTQAHMPECVWKSFWGVSSLYPVCPWWPVSGLQVWFKHFTHKAVLPALILKYFQMCFYYFSHISICVHVLMCMPHVCSSGHRGQELLDSRNGLLGAIQLGCWKLHLGLCRSSKHSQPWIPDFGFLMSVQKSRFYDWVSSERGMPNHHDWGLHVVCLKPLEFQWPRHQHWGSDHFKAKDQCSEIQLPSAKQDPT